MTDTSPSKILNFGLIGAGAWGRNYIKTIDGLDGMALTRLASRNPENLEPTAREIEAMGRKCLSIPTNIRDPESVDQLVDTAIEQMGKIDFLINNAGGQFPSNPLDISDNGWRAVVDLNLNGTWNVTSRVGKHMVANNFGAIVNIVHIYS